MTPKEPGSCYYDILSFSTLGRSEESAYKCCLKRFPEGVRLFYWMEGLPNVPNMACNMCSGAWHPATGHIDVAQNRLWCNPCTRGMFRTMKENMSRKCGGYRFGDYATVPPYQRQIRIAEDDPLLKDIVDMTNIIVVPE